MEAHGLMENWLNAGIAYWHWLIIGLLLLGAEMFLAGFILFWFGASAIVVGLLMLLIPLGFRAQLLIWAGLSILSVLVWNRFIRPGWKYKTLSGMAHETLIGQVGMVLESNRGKTRGKLRFPAPVLGEDEWTFICGQDVVVGVRVRVTEISGNTLIVEPV